MKRLIINAIYCIFILWSPSIYAGELTDATSDFLGWLGLKDSDIRTCDADLNVNPKSWLEFDKEKMVVDLPLWEKFTERQIVFFSSGVKDNKAEFTIHTDSQHCAKIKIYDFEDFTSDVKKIGFRLYSDEDLVVRTVHYTFLNTAKEFSSGKIESDYRTNWRHSNLPFWLLQLDPNVLASESGIVMKLFYYDYSTLAESQEERINLFVKLNSAMDDIRRELDHGNDVTIELRDQLELSSINIVRSFPVRGTLEGFLRDDYFPDVLFLNVMSSIYNLIKRGQFLTKSELAGQLPLKLLSGINAAYTYRYKYLCNERDFVENFGSVSRKLRSFDILEFYMNRSLHVAKSADYSKFVNFFTFAESVQRENHGTFKNVLTSPNIVEKLKSLDSEIRDGKDRLATPLGQLNAVFSRLRNDLMDISETRYKSFIKAIS